ncbi:TetR/AcrR family transcriptional regulator [Cohnella suwonensis]|uniref:TetR/AcrR family transcriptional regulator n=1 Tax=Cohnella suwonensis TaxID=696072 RepID=A0ABW0M0N7_9BACL
MRAGVTTETVITAAADIADREGWDQITLANVAGHLGIRTPSLYNHVGGLPDLRRKLSVHGANLLYDSLADAAIGRSGEQALTEVGKAYVDFARRRPGLYEAMNRTDDSRPEQFDLAAEQTLRLIVRLMEPLGVGPDDYVPAVRGLRSMFHGFASLESMGGFRMDEDVMDSVVKAITIYLKGLRKTDVT